MLQILNKWPVVKPIPNASLLKDEVDFLSSHKELINYYDYIIQNINIKNDTNSHIMYVIGKTDFLDPSRPVNKRDANISLPDVDMDVPCGFRSSVIEHLQNRYGKDRIGYIITFMRLDGRGIIKEVFRITEPTEASFEVADAITKNMVDASKVQDILEDLKDEDPTYNIIQYNIDHIPAVASFNKEYPETFAIALKMSGSIKNTGRHAAGLVITNKKIGDVFPIIHDKVTGENIVAFEMSDLEYAGGVKFDILGVAAYDKIDAICELINSERLEIEELI